MNRAWPLPSRKAAPHIIMVLPLSPEAGDFFLFGSENGVRCRSAPDAIHHLLSGWRTVLELLWDGSPRPFVFQSIGSGAEPGGIRRNLDSPPPRQLQLSYRSPGASQPSLILDSLSLPPSPPHMLLLYAMQETSLCKVKKS